MGACPDTCGCRRTCPPKPRCAPPARRSASLRRGSARRDGARRFRFSHPAERRPGRCRSLVRGRPPSRSASTSASRRQRRSSFVGLPPTPASPSPSWSGARALDRPVVSRTDATTIRELRRLGGLLKKVHLDSGGAYSRETASALDRPARGDRPARRRGRRRVVIVKKVGTSKTAAPKSKASNVRALIDYIAGVRGGRRRREGRAPRRRQPPQHRPRRSGAGDDRPRRGRPSQPAAGAALDPELARG